MEKSKKVNGADAAGKKRSHRPHLEMAVEALSRRVNKLEAAADQNTAIFVDSFKMLEIQMNVVHEVISMLHEDGRGLATSNGKVDFNYYMQRYLSKLAENEEKKGAPPPTSILSTPDDESPIIFGGDTT